MSIALLGSLLALLNVPIDLRFPPSESGCWPPPQLLPATAAFRAWMDPFAVPRISITIKAEDYAVLKAKRDAIMARGFSIGRSDTVPGVVSYEGQAFPAKFRLGGSNLDHYVGSKWTLHVHLKGGRTLMGLSRFTIHAPPVRGFYYERLFDDHLAREDEMYLSYDYASFTINGREIGLMLVARDFQPEAQDRPDGVTAKPHIWDTLPGDKGLHRNANVAYHFMYQTDAFQWRGYSVETSQDGGHPRQAALMRSMIRAFQLNTLPASDVFDPEAMGRFLAISELWGVWHGTEWGDMRFYLNPYTLKIEPISNEPDVHFRWGGPLEAAYRHSATSPVTALFNDPVIREAFFRNLKRITSASYIDALCAYLDNREAMYRLILSREYTSLPPSPIPMLKARAALLQKETADESNLFINYYSTSNDLEWKEWGTFFPQQLHKHGYYLPNLYPLHVSVHKVNRDGKVFLEFNQLLPRTLPGKPPFSGTITVSRIVIRAGAGDQPLSGIGYPFQLSPGHPVYLPVPKGLSGNISGTLYGTIGRQPEASVAFVSHDMEPPLESPPLPVPSLAQALDSYPFLEYGDRTLTVTPGRWTVDRPMIIPRGLTLAIPEGTTLEFKAGGFIRTSSPLRFLGTKARPVTLQGYQNATWAGIAVLEADQESILRNVAIIGAGGAGKDSSVPGCHEHRQTER
jgi:hypothetical protein